MQISDQHLAGLARQGLNLAKRDKEEHRSFAMLLAAVLDGGELFRMQKVERMIAEKFGEEWLNNGAAKDAVFDGLALILPLRPPDALVFVTATNRFEPTEKYWTLSAAEKRAITSAGHDGHHQAVRDGYYTVEDSFTAVAQTSERVCVVTQFLDRDPLAANSHDTRFFDQRDFGGRLKMYGRGEEREEREELKDVTKR